MRVRLGKLLELWRYPVMGLQGERLQRAEIREAGVVGDHSYVFRNTELSRVIDPVTYAHYWGETLAFSSMLDLKARFASQGESPGLNIITPNGRSLSSGDPNFTMQIKEAPGASCRATRVPAGRRNQTEVGSRPAPDNNLLARQDERTLP